MKRNLLLAAAATALMAASGTASATGPSPAGTQAMQQQQSQRSSGQTHSMAAMEQMLGKTVVGSDGAAIGQITDIMLNPDTREPNVAIIDARGGKQVAVDFTLLDPQGERVVANTLTQQQLAQMPEFRSSDNNMVSLNQNRGQSGQKGQKQ
ncbi:PRC-barrel domain-containing protein [Azospirillum sp.]|uniref:PRC-barrel domain-containing protein n=1 Tax=Azospirillum sp. TaxID=34012 RepID=UPI002D2AC72B|nr:PRC-barrel domain-containing protein [Azospirillum sp.]HYD68570.1 PRC-barrel domain-containing protein [Azospirillum sp.]